MSKMYDEYLQQHKGNVARGFLYIKNYLPELLKDLDINDLEWQICYNHDFSKNDPEEYDAYDQYFYGKNKSFEVVNNFNYAWLRHIHHNPHHWQYWILVNDDPEEGDRFMDIPYNYIIEMICDWWSFSWTKGDLTEIFNWYDQHRERIKMSVKSRESVEHILNTIKQHIEAESEQ